MPHALLISLFGISCQALPFAPEPFGTEGQTKQHKEERHVPEFFLFDEGTFGVDVLSIIRKVTHFGERVILAIRGIGDRLQHTRIEGGV